MRRAISFCALVLSLSVLACGGENAGGSAPPDLDEDYSPNFTGSWNLTIAISMAGTTQSSSEVASVTRAERNVVQIQEVCGSKPMRAVIASASSLKVDPVTCTMSVDCPNGTSTAQLTITGGTGGITDGELSVSLSGTASACGLSLPFALQASGSRTTSP